MKHSLRLSLAILGFGLAGVAAFAAAAATAGLDRTKLRSLDTAINQAIEEEKLPGAVVWIEHAGAIYQKAYGNRALVPAVEKMTADTIFDAASLTKVVAGAPALMLLVERGQVKLEATVQTYIPEFTGEGREKVTVRQLLTHTSGILADVETKTDWTGNDTAIRKACAEKLRAEPGTEVRYSDVNLFLCGEIVQRLSGLKLDAFCQKEFYGPLKMVDTGFLPPAEKLPRIAPTQMTEGKMLRGVVHDPTARKMGGVAGHAGIFTTAADLARFARMMLNLGELDGVRVFKPETVKLMTSVQTPPALRARRGFGWDIDSPYSRPRGETFPLGSYGHTGFTGNAYWIDPFSKTFFVFLSNRVHPDGKGDVLELYKTAGTAAASAVPDFDFGFVPDALAPQIAQRGKPEKTKMDELRSAVPPVLNGIDVLARDNFALLKGLRVGLVTNPSGRNYQRYPTIDLLRNAPGVDLKLLFGPEHGLYALLDEAVGDSVDERTGLPIYSLYGKRQAPLPEHLKQIDALVFDIQDVGARFYTYTSTLGLCMEAAYKAGIKFVLLDRVNPINGVQIDGPVHTIKTSFVGYHPVPVRTGMTQGELALMYKAERKWDGLDLAIVKLEGWKRGMWFDETGQPWINPSPAMRNMNAATLYTGLCLIESCEISLGRGTGTPFEIVGAPYIHDLKFAEALNNERIPGVRFVPIRFTPTDYVFKNQSCAGVSVIVTDRDHAPVCEIGIAMAKILNRWYPEHFTVSKMNRLLGDAATLEAIKADKSLAEIRQLWSANQETFKARREKYLIYK
ncbi:MAG: DUF1343 domain-containing protein [Opitutae bacterium]|nr:DUF1343 domain-containing protein [Opitutae bacterium]